MTDMSDGLEVALYRLPTSNCKQTCAQARKTDTQRITMMTDKLHTCFVKYMQCKSTLSR